MAEALQPEGLEDDHEIFTIGQQPLQFLPAKIGDVTYDVPDFHEMRVRRRYIAELNDARATYWRINRADTLREGVPRAVPYQDLLTKQMAILVPDCPRAKAEELSKEEIEAFLVYIGWISEEAEVDRQDVDPPNGAETKAEPSPDSPGSTESTPNVSSIWPRTSGT